MKPDFLIVGTMKSGTTTLAQYLNQHKQIFMPSFEVHFFDNPSQFAKGFDWYTNLFSNATSNQITGEKTPAYSLKETYSEKIAQLLPEVKLIWMFRNPVNRAYSNYWHAVRTGAELKSFHEALKIEERRIEKGKEYLAYKKRGMYCEQIKNFNKNFSRDQNFYILFEDFIKNPEFWLTKLYRFLEINDDPSVIQEPKKANVAVQPKNKRLQWFLRSLKKIGKPKGKAIFKPNGFIANIFHSISDKNKKEKTGYPPMENHIREELYNFYEEWFDEFQDLTGLNVEKWRRES